MLCHCSSVSMARRVTTLLVLMTGTPTRTARHKSSIKFHSIPLVTSVAPMDQCILALWFYMCVKHGL
jgi:hypothetical protein